MRAGSKVGLEMMPIDRMTVSDGQVQENAHIPADRYCLVMLAAALGWRAPKDR